MNRNVLLGAVLAATVALVSAGSARSAERAIEKSAVIDATLDQAWDSWTTRDGIIGFFAPDAKIEPMVLKGIAWAAKKPYDALLTVRAARGRSSGH